MTDGYYLSIYSHVGQLAAAMDVGVRHDQNMALWKKTNNSIHLIKHWEFERLTGVKNHSLSFPDKNSAINFISEKLKSLNIEYKQIISIIGTPGIHGIFPASIVWHEQERYTYHNLCHLYSGLLLDTDLFKNESILALALDGGPDPVVDIDARQKHFYTGAYSNKGNVEYFHIPSPAVLWSMLRNRLRLAEGSLMALGSATTAEYIHPVPFPPALYTISEIAESAQWFDELYNNIMSISETDEGKSFVNLDKSFSLQENKISMLVKIVQNYSQELVSNTIRDLVKKFSIDTKNTYLSITGGYALNCPSNSHIMNKHNFLGFIAPPAVNDSGMSLGMGLQFFYHNVPDFNFKFNNAYQGTDDKTLHNIVKDPEFSDFIESIKPLDTKELVEDLQLAPIVWFDAESEMGPRALGHRSILADPRTFKTKDQLNHIKQRQWWRPVAPIVLMEEMNTWFESGYTSPYMLHTFTIRKEKEHLVPAISHLDSSARVQTVRDSDDHNLYQIIKGFFEKTGVPMICNTSLNDKDEPIINTIAEALNFSLRKKIDVIYINSNRVKLRNHNSYEFKSPRKRSDLHYFILKSDQHSNLLPLNRRQAMIYYHNPRLQTHGSSEKEIENLLRKINKIDRMFGKRADFQFIDIWHFVEHDHEKIVQGLI